MLDKFDPLIGSWFREKYGRPTDVQERAWPLIMSNEHVLATAPTGTGKTLAAFLWSLEKLLTGAWSTGCTSVLYVSPLKALNNDIRRNLLEPLADLHAAGEAAGRPFPPVQVLTRSGDTPESDRRRMQRHPPEILITTPESLSLLLSSRGGRSILTSLRAVILDEIHALVATKRGTLLMSGVERLVRLSGEFQRIALSATIRPLDAVARFVGGFRLEGDVASPRYVPRPVSTVRSDARKEFDVSVRFPDEGASGVPADSIWDSLSGEFGRIIDRNRSTLLFVGSRRLAEKLTFNINAGRDQPVAYAHHGSLSREIRTEVERRLKAGELRAIVATSSLEMGIDIGALDEVVLVQAPRSIASAVQRVGRAGHRVGDVSRAVIYPTHPQDFIEAAVLARGILDQDIEETRPVAGALDVLAQVIVSMTGVETWDMDELFATIRTIHPYRHLPREHFDLVLRMMAGRYSETRVRELRPRLSVDRMDNTVAARPGALMALYASGGVIPDRGYFQMRHEETGSRIGELDEEFVWEAKAGQIFTLGTQNWRIERITHNDVLVRPARPTAMAAPFWRAEEQDRDFHFSQRIGAFLALLDGSLDDPGLPSILTETYRMDAAAGKRLIDYLERQRRETGCALPHRHHVMVEHTSTGPGGAPGNQVVMHTFWGGRVNRPYAMALDAAWEEAYGANLEIYAANDCIVLLLPHEVRTEALISLVTSANADRLLRRSLEGSGFFGARFRECAGRALLLERPSPGRRMPLWMSRLKSQKLYGAVRSLPDFPITLEAWRTCLQDEFDMDGLKLVLSELESGAVTWSESHTAHPSPMARGVTFRQVNQYMYMDDGAPAAQPSSLRADLMQQLLFTPGLRPAAARETIRIFEEKRQRIHPGYSPSSPRDLLDWIKERVLIPEAEWRTLLDAMVRDHGPEASAWPEALGDRVVRAAPPLASEILIAASENMGFIAAAHAGGPELPGVRRLLSNDPADPFPGGGEEDGHEEAGAALSRMLSEWISFYGPMTPAGVAATLGLEPAALTPVLDDLMESRKIIGGRLSSDGSGDEICDSENFEILLRMSRAAARPAVEPMPADRLPLFIAAGQAVGRAGASVDDLFRCAEQLAGLYAKAELWEKEILPARVHPYATTMLDTILAESDLLWIGKRDREIAFCFDSDLDLMVDDPAAAAGEGESGASAPSIFPDTSGRYDFNALLAHTGLAPSKLFEGLWDAVWEGKATNDSFHALRRGIASKFRLPRPIAAEDRAGSGRRMRGRRSSFSRWKGSIPFVGNWRILPRPLPETDLIEAEEKKKDRARMLLDRYGIVFRELLSKESGPFTWAALFRTLRLMEMSGEVIGGYFFHGIPGPQFMSHRAFRRFQQGMDETAVFWLNAADPASLCGTGLEALRGTLPRRLPGTHLVYRGPDLALVSEGQGKNLKISVPPDDPDLASFLVPLRHLLTRHFQPLPHVTVRTINRKPARTSPYVEALRTGFDVHVDTRDVTLYVKRS